MISLNSIEDIVINSKQKLNFKLSDMYNNIFKELYNIFNNYNYKIFLFGSFSKGLIHKNSDIDILLLVPNTRLERNLKLNIRDDLDSNLIEVMLKYDIEIDVKIYGEIDFIMATKRNYFEQSIIKDLIELNNCIRS